MITAAMLKHRVEVVPLRKRKPLKAWSEKMATFSLKEATSTEAPVALLVDSGGPVPTPVRVFEGRFYAPTRNPLEDPRNAASAWLTQLAGNAEKDTFYRGTKPKVRFIPSMPLRMDMVVEDGVERRSSLASFRTKLQARADTDLLSIDGVLHERTKSPLVMMEHLSKAFVGGGKTLVARLSGRTVSTWFEDPEALRSVFEEASARGVKSAATARKALSALSVQFVDPALIDACRADVVDNTDFRPVVQEAEWRWLNERPSSVSYGYQSAPRSAEIRIHFLGWDVARATAEGDTDIAAVAKAVGSIYVEKDQWSDYEFPPEHEGAWTRLKVTEDFSVPYLADLRRKDPGQGSKMPAEISVPKLDETAAVRVAMMENPDVEIWKHGDHFYAIDPKEPIIVGDGSDELSYAVPVAALSYGEKFVSASNSMTAMEHTAKNDLADIGGRIAHRCREPVLLVMPDSDDFTNMRIDWKWTGLPGKIDKRPFVFGLDSFDEGLAFAERMKIQPYAHPPVVRSVDASKLGRDHALWNLKVAVLAILSGMDARARMLSPKAFAATGMMGDVLESWRMSTNWKDPEGMEEIMIAGAGTLVDEIDDPFFDDIFHPEVIAIARTSLERLHMADIKPDIEPEEEYAILAM